MTFLDDFLPHPRNKNNYWAVQRADQENWGGAERKYLDKNRMYQINKNFQIHFKMKLTGGLKYGDDSPDPHKYEKVEFDANRKKTNFEKDMDDLLFSGRPAPRRRRNQEEGTSAQSQKQQETKKQAPKQTETASKSSLPLASNTKIVQKPTKPALNISNQSAQSKASSKNVKPTPITDKNVEAQEDHFKQSPPSIVIEQPKVERQIDTEEHHYKVSNTRNNRPAYVRKLKKTAEDFDFYTQNGQKHVAYEVVRPKECVRENVLRDNVMGFQDREFPPDSYSIGPKYRSELVIWKKPSEIYKSPVFGKYIEPNDIQPGTLSSPQFLSVLSCLAEKEQNVKRLIENQKLSPNGFYYVRLNINGVWRYISVDHNLPELNGAALGARSYDDSEAELWPSIIEKAYAKAYQGYVSFNENTPREHYLRDLTGASVKKYYPKNSNFSWVIGDALEKGWPVLAVAKQNIQEIGFNPNYSLSVLKCNSKGALELRSSWGTLIERPKVQINKEGVFELSSNQTADFISHILIAETDDALSSTTIESKHYGSFYSCFKFTVKDTTYGTISLSQIDRRMFSINSDYDYVPFRAILQMKNADGIGNSLYVSAAFSHHSRNLDLPVNLAPGDYHLYCIGQWPHQPYDFNATIFAKQRVSIKKVYYANFPNILAEALTQENLSKGKKSGKGQVEEYVLYHEASNLVLITAKSLTGKPYKYTLNLSQVKLDGLSLLNAAYPEDNFSQKTRIQLQEMKHGYLENKNWEVELLGEQAYTWVFSSFMDYDPNNFKIWGFK